MSEWRGRERKKFSGYAKSLFAEISIAKRQTKQITIEKSDKLVNSHIMELHGHAAGLKGRVAIRIGLRPSESLTAVRFEVGECKIYSIFIKLIQANRD